MLEYVPRLRKGGAVPLLPLYVLMAWREKSLPLLFIIVNEGSDVIWTVLAYGQVQLALVLVMINLQIVILAYVKLIIYSVQFVADGME